MSKDYSKVFVALYFTEALDIMYVMKRVFLELPTGEILKNHWLDYLRGELHTDEYLAMVESWDFRVTQINEKCWEANMFKGTTRCSTVVTITLEDILI